LIEEVVGEKCSQVFDATARRSGRYHDTVRSEAAIPSFSSSAWMRGLPERRFSAAMRRMRA
jgi:hypothetical protein